MGIFDTRKFIFKEARLTAEVRKIFVPHQLLEGANGALMLIKPTTGIFLYNEQRNEFLPAPDAFPMPSKWYLNGVRWDEKIRKYWITSDSWIVQFDPATNQLNYRGHTFTSTATGNMLNTMIGRSFLLN
ncbi:MAG: hypothetical protein H0U44_11955 [Flavisolibacter sp.]|nr:hypothetical protein [Flavisolibacter sp.]